jgi:hypothetical protein
MNYMIEQIHSLPELLNQIYEPLDDTIRRKVDHELCLSAKRLYVVGCGDSHHAALSTELAFESLTKLPDDPMTSMLFARYAAGFIPQSGPKNERGDRYFSFRCCFPHGGSAADGQTGRCHHPGTDRHPRQPSGK